MLVPLAPCRVKPHRNAARRQGGAVGSIAAGIAVVVRMRRNGAQRRRGLNRYGAAPHLWEFVLCCFFAPGAGLPALPRGGTAWQSQLLASGKSEGNCPLTGLNQGFAGFFVALLPLGIALRATGRLDCADRWLCREARTSVTTTNKGNQP
ncbi:hypothetical protein [Cupriavidus necator]|uniref:hypothetical protein n=1 Tax=Cupriavidus necator TaxID=106590 RepID=UPI0030F3A86E